MGTAAEARRTAVRSLFHLEQALARYRAVVAKQLGLGLQDVGLLNVLAWCGERATPSELAQELNLSSATLTSMLDRVEEAGLVRRVPNPDDRRSIFVELTGLGRQGIELFDGSMNQALGGLAEWEAKAMSRGLTLLAGRLRDDARSGTVPSSAHREGGSPRPGVPAAQDELPRRGR